MDYNARRHCQGAVILHHIITAEEHQDSPTQPATLYIYIIVCARCTSLRHKETPYGCRPNWKNGRRTPGANRKLPAFPI